MNKNNDLDRQLDALKTPSFEYVKHQNAIKLPLLHADRTATAGFWLVVLPTFFLCCVAMKYFFHIHSGFFDILGNMLTEVRNDRIGRLLVLVFLLVAPLVSVAVNLLAIVHVAHDRPRNELIITVKIKFWNVLLAAVSLCVAAVFCLYLISEQFRNSNTSTVY